MRNFFSLCSLAFFLLSGYGYAFASSGARKKQEGIATKPSEQSFKQKKLSKLKKPNSLKKPKSKAYPLGTVFYKQRRRRRKTSGWSRLWHDMHQFWTPKVRYVAKANREYWTPKVRYVAKANREYWKPKLDHMLKANREYWGPRMNQQYLPFVRQRYQTLQKRYGQPTSKVYREIVELIRPVVVDAPVFLFKTSYESLPKQYRHSLEHVPSPIKRIFDKYLVWSIENLPKRIQLFGDRLPEDIRDNISMLAEAMKPSHDLALKKRLERSLDLLRPHAGDPSMRSCYRVIALDSDVINAFNTGCTIFVTKGLARVLEKRELLAVMAHEMAHGDAGHAVKNIWLFAQSVGVHVYRLILEETQWFLTGRWGETLNHVVKKGSFPALLHAYGKHAPAVELDADRRATKILLRAGGSPSYLIRALKKLHGHPIDKDVKHSKKTINGLRDYPGLYQRVQMVDKTWKTSLRQKKKTLQVR